MVAAYDSINVGAPLDAEQIVAIKMKNIEEDD